MTIVQDGRSGSVTLSTEYSYFDTGMMQVARDVNGQTTTYSYGNCANALVDAITHPLSLTENQTWDCNGGVQTSTTDVNGQNWSTAYSDPLWRPTTTTDPTKVSTAYTYSSPNTSVLTVNGNSSAEDILTTLDVLGRVKLTQRRQAPGAALFDSVETTYDPTGRVSRTTFPFSQG